MFAVFLQLYLQRNCGLQNSTYLGLVEKVAIFRRIGHTGDLDREIINIGRWADALCPLQVLDFVADEPPLPSRSTILVGDVLKDPSAKPETCCGD